MPTITPQAEVLAPYTQEDLGKLGLALPSVNVVSHKGPGESGGVSTSLEPMAEQLSTTVRWIALSGIPFTQDRRVTGFSFYQPEVPEAVVDRHNRTCINYLFPLLHGQTKCANFDQENWRAYRHLCELMATETLRAAGDNYPSLFWIHDYQMALVAPLLAIEAGAIVCQFWHVPWPSPEVMVASPIGKELTDALLSNRLLGFHTTGYALNFLNTVQEFFPDASVDLLTMEVRRKGTVTKVLAVPLGLDFAYWQRLAKINRPRAAAIPKKYALASQLVLGVDRLDYTKGVLEKLAGIEAFLQSQNGWNRRFHYVQLAQPPQAVSPEFTDYAVQAREKAHQINAKYGSDSWQPILWLEGNFEHSDLAAWYQAADVLAVTPVADGLNLIAKEYVACRTDEQGALVLSRQAGCAAELSTSCFLVDAYDPQGIANSIAQALSTVPEEKRRRMLAMRHRVAWNQLSDWAYAFLRQAVTTR